MKLNRKEIEILKAACEKADFTGLHPESQADAQAENIFTIALCSQALQSDSLRELCGELVEAVTPFADKKLFIEGYEDEFSRVVKALAKAKAVLKGEG